MTQGHNFKNKTTKNSKSHAHLQIMMKHSAKFQVNSIKDLAGVARTSFESASAVTLSKMAETKIKKTPAHLHFIRRQTVKFHISQMKDVRGVVGIRSDGLKDRQKDGWNDIETRVISIAPPHSPPPPLHLRWVTKNVCLPSPIS